ncbi:MAG: Gldg family protein, partial [Spirochaetota bacterium]
MNKSTEKYLYIASPLLILASLFIYYINYVFGTWSMVTLGAGVAVGAVFFVRFRKEIAGKVSRRKLRYGTNSILITIFVLALVVIAYLVVMEHNKRFDLTSMQKFSLSSQTKTVLQKLEGEVHAYAFYGKNQSPASIVELFKQYKYNYKDFEYSVIDPDLNPGKVEEYGVEEYGDIVLEYQGRTQQASSPNEEGVTNALIKLSRTQVKPVYFITGHGERGIEDSGNNGYGNIKAAIRAENYDVKELLLLGEKQVPEDCAVLISAGPKTDYTQHEIDIIQEYLQQGGRVFFLLDPRRDVKLNNIAAFLDRTGLIAGRDVIIDPMSRVFSGDYFMPVISNYTYNPITRNFGISTFMKYVRSMRVKDNPGENIRVREVARSSENSWAEADLEGLYSGRGAKFNEDQDIKGPVSVMAYSTITFPQKAQSGSSHSDSSEQKTPQEQQSTETEKTQEGVVLAVGDSDFVTNSMY